MNEFIDILGKYKEARNIASSFDKTIKTDGKLVDSWDIGFNVPDYLETTNDKVNHPSHYTGDIECIDAMLQQFGEEQVKSFCLLNAFKYLWRCDKKHETPKEDISKAVWYLSKYLEYVR